MSDSLCILIITGEYPPMQGGVADYTHIIATRLNDRGHEVHVLTSVEAQQDLSPIIVHADMSDWRWSTLKRSLRHLCESIHPDVINIQYQTAAFEMRPAINLLSYMGLGIPIVTTFHDLRVPYLFPKAGPLRWQTNRALAKASAAVITTNPEDTARLMQKERLGHVHEIPIGSNISPILPPDFDRDQWRAKWDLPQDALVLCYFGFLNQSKGGLDLILALKHLVERHPDAQLLFVGGATGASDPTNEEYAHKIRKLIAENLLSNNVHWTGHVSDQAVSAAFACSDICTLPFRDGVSLRRGSLMAALVHGMPIISTTPRTPLPEIVHGENMWLVKPNMPAAISWAVQAIASDDALCRRLSAGARELANRYDWKNITSRTLEVLCDACRK